MLMNDLILTIRSAGRPGRGRTTPAIRRAPTATVAAFPSDKSGFAPVDQLPSPRQVKGPQYSWLGLYN